MLAQVSNEALISAGARGAIFLIVIAVTCRLWTRRPITGAYLVLQMCGVALVFADHRDTAALLGIISSALIGVVLIKYVRHEPRRLSVLLAAREADWSKERHDLINDHQAEIARRILAERKLMQVMDELSGK